VANGEFERLRNDLDTIHAALGLDRLWMRDALRISILFGVAGLMAFAWAQLPHGLAPIWGFAVFLIPTTEWVRSARRAAQTDEAGDVWRETRAAFRTLWILLPIAGLFVWTRYVGLELVQFLGLSVFVLSTVMFATAVGNRQETWLLGWALGWMIGSLVVAACIAEPVGAIAAAIGFGGFVSAVICAVQLRKEQDAYAN
jgi:hypothetical protein